MSYTSGPFAKQARFVLETYESIAPLNTAKAYEPKEIEFIQFCRTIYGSGESSTAFTEIGTEEKVFPFLFYTAYKDKRKRGKFKQVRSKRIREAGGIDTGKEGKNGTFD